MSFSQIVMLVLVGLVGLVVYSCMPSSYSWHQKLTLEVETPSGIITGSSVVYVTMSTQFVAGFGSKGSSGKRGEAVVMEITPGKPTGGHTGGPTSGRYLFALLKGQTHLAQKVFDVTGPGVRFNEWAGTLSRLRGTGDVPEAHYPLLVTFTDINDPSSVKKVEPWDLESHFGAGVKLKRITLEITDEAVTSGKVEKVLGKEFFKRWGAVHKEALGRGLKDSYFDSLMSELSRGDFVGRRK